MMAIETYEAAKIGVTVVKDQYFVTVLLLCIHGKQIWSRQLTLPHYSWAGSDLLGG